jgi:hypothetical protein
MLGAHGEDGQNVSPRCAPAEGRAAQAQRSCRRAEEPRSSAIRSRAGAVSLDSDIPDSPRSRECCGVLPLETGTSFCQGGLAIWVDVLRHLFDATWNDARGRDCRPQSRERRAVGAGERTARLRAQVEALTAQAEPLAAQAGDRQTRAAMDRHTSPKPPTSDGLKRRKKSLEKKSGKKPGEQLVRRGQTLHLVVVPDEIVEQRPAICTHCHSATHGQRHHIDDRPPAQ